MRGQLDPVIALLLGELLQQHAAPAPASPIIVPVSAPPLTPGALLQLLAQLPPASLAAIIQQLLQQMQIPAGQLTGTVPAAALSLVPGLPSMGPGAGTIGGGANYILSLTLDAQGRVTAVTTGSPSSPVRKEFDDWNITSPAASNTDYPFLYLIGNGQGGKVMLRPGSITGIHVDLYGAGVSITAGSVTVKVWKNGVATGALVTASSGTNARATFAASTYAYSAGDSLDIRFTTSSNYVTGGGGYQLVSGFEVTE